MRTIGRAALRCAAWSLLLCVASAREPAPGGHWAGWLERVEAVITPAERRQWQTLQGDEERRGFVESFWRQRTPEGGDWQAVEREHDRRVEYAEQRFTAGRRGSRTDRGRIYIQMGPPLSISRMASGPRRDTASRDPDLLRRFGGESTLGQDKPAEIWTYGHIPGAAASSNEIKFLFLDRHHSGLYELAYDFGDADRLWLLDSDPTLLAEREEGSGRMASARDVIGMQRAARERLERSPTHPAVSAAVSFERLPLAASVAVFRGSDGRGFVAVAASVPARELHFVRLDGRYRAQLELEGRVLRPDGVAVRSFAAGAEVELDAGQWAERHDLHQQLQAGVAALEPGEYAVEIVVLDRHSSRVGVTQDRLDVPTFVAGGTSLSSVVLASRIERRERRTPGRKVSLGPMGGLGEATVELADPGAEEPDRPFDFGALAVQPLGSEPVRSGGALGAYLQIYDPGLRADCGCPDLLVRWSLHQGERLVSTLGEPKRLAEPLAGARPLVGTGRMLQLGRLEPGAYRMRATVEDRVRGTRAESEAPLTIVR